MEISAFRIQKAFANREFTPFYQPIVSGETRNITGCEVLARWLMPEKGLLSAGYFIEEIERFRLTQKLAYILVDEVLQDVADNLPTTARRDKDFHLTFNVSLSTLFTPVFSQSLIAFSGCLKRAGITAVFEITEREDMRHFPQAVRQFRKLAEQGLQFAVDDFGAGYANEALAVASRATFIKIDASFIADPQCPVSARFIDNTLALAHRLKARVIAEGVETPAQEKWLAGLGVDYLQGYRYGRPMPAGLFRFWLTKRRSHAVQVSS